MTKHFSEPDMYGEIASPEGENRYFLTADQIRGIAEGYAWLAQEYSRMKMASDIYEKAKIARNVLDKALPNYRKVLPIGLSVVPREPVHPGELEKTCQDILIEFGIEDDERQMGKLIEEKGIKLKDLKFESYHD